MPVISIPKEVFEIVPRPRTANIAAAVRSAIDSGSHIEIAPVKGPYTTVTIPDDLYAVINTGRGAAVKFVAAAIKAYDWGEAPPVEIPVRRSAQRQHDSGERSVRPAVPTTHKQARVYKERIDRVKTAIEDLEDGKWAHLFLTAGHRSVDPWRPDGDFHDEIGSGIVFRCVIPPTADAEAAFKWVSERHASEPRVHRMHWYYIDGDSETLMDAKDAALRARMFEHGPEGLERLREIEAAEALQIKLLGRKAAYIELAKKDVLALGVEAPDAVKKICGKPID